MNTTTETIHQPISLRHELDVMHAGYVESVNAAVEADDLGRALELARAYDDEATTLVAVRENRTDLLPLRRLTRKAANTRRRAGWLRRAA